MLQTYFVLATSEHPSGSPLAPDLKELQRAGASRRGPVALIRSRAHPAPPGGGPPSQVLSPGCRLSQGHSGSVKIRPREEPALLEGALGLRPFVRTSGCVISGKHDLPGEHGFQCSATRAAMHIRWKQPETICFPTVLAKECVWPPVSGRQGRLGVETVDGYKRNRPC